MDKTNSLFVNRLQSLLDSKGEKFGGVASKIGIDRSALSRWKKGDGNNITNVTLMKLGDYFGVNPVWLMGYDVPKHVNTVNVKPIPLLGKCSAGSPILALSEYEKVEIVEELSAADFAITVKGDSMINARIMDGDIVFVKKQDDVLNGEIAVVLIDEEVTLKRVYKTHHKITLHSENPVYDDMVFFKSDFKNIKILGKAVEVKFKL